MIVFSSTNKKKNTQKRQLEQINAWKGNLLNINFTNPWPTPIAIQQGFLKMVNFSLSYSSSVMLLNSSWRLKTKKISARIKLCLSGNFLLIFARMKRCICSDEKQLRSKKIRATINLCLFGYFWKEFLLFLLKKNNRPRKCDVILKAWC